MPQLSSEEYSKLIAWIVNESINLQLEGLEPSLFASYVKSLLSRDVPEDAMVSSLEDFLPAEQAQSFVSLLHKRLKAKDFSFEDNKAPTETPKAESEKPREKETKKEAKESRDRRDKEPEKKSKDREVVELSRYESVKKRPRNEEKAKPKEESKPYKQKPTEKPPKKFEKRRKFSSDESETESDENEDTQQLSLVNADQEPEVKPNIVKERFIVYVAGLEEQYNTIVRIYKAFQQFGRIAGIEEDKANGVCFIEYSKLSYAYRAVKKGAKTLHNSLLRVEFANEPDPDALAAIDAQIEERRKAWTEKQNKEEPELSEKDSLIQGLKNTLQQKVEKFGSLGENDVEEKAKLKKEIEELTDMINDANKI